MARLTAPELPPPPNMDGVSVVEGGLLVPRPLARKLLGWVQTSKAYPRAAQLAMERQAGVGDRGVSAAYTYFNDLIPVVVSEAVAEATPVRWYHVLLGVAGGVAAGLVIGILGVWGASQ